MGWGRSRLERARTAVSDTIPLAARSAASSRGQPLPAATRALLEPQLGHDFSRVRIHSDTEAAAGARAVGAHAYTLGDHIVFGAGRYQPDTPAGQRLLAHELTHTAQQAQGGVRLQRQGIDPLTQQPMDPGEGRAAQTAAGIRPGPGRPDPAAQWAAYEACLGRGTAMHECQAYAGLEAFPDMRTPVLQQDLALFQDLVTTITDFRARITALLAGTRPAGASNAWITSANPNVAAVMALLDALIGDLQARRLVIRFDQPTTGRATAAYDFTGNLMHLRPFTDANSRVSVAVGLVHEYTHAMQDRVEEALLARRTAPLAHGEADEEQHEIDARRQEAYFMRLLIAAGVPFHGESRFEGGGIILAEDVDAQIWVSRFETARTGTRRERQSALLEISAVISSNYGAQVAANTPTQTYVIRVEGGDQAVLYPGGTAPPVSLGVVPNNVLTRDRLVQWVSPLVRSSAVFASLFRGGGGVSFPLAVFVIVHGGRVVGDFALAPP